MIRPGATPIRVYFLSRYTKIFNKEKKHFWPPVRYIIQTPNKEHLLFCCTFLFSWESWFQHRIIHPDISLYGNWKTCTRVKWSYVCTHLKNTCTHSPVTDSRASSARGVDGFIIFRRAFDISARDNGQYFTKRLRKLFPKQLFHFVIINRVKNIYDGKHPSFP